MITVEEFERPQIGFLNNILRVLAVSGEPKSQVKSRVQMGQGDLFKLTVRVLSLQTISILLGYRVMTAYSVGLPVIGCSVNQHN